MRFGVSVGLYGCIWRLYRVWGLYWVSIGSVLSVYGVPMRFGVSMGPLWGLGSLWVSMDLYGISVGLRGIYGVSMGSL